MRKLQSRRGTCLPILNLRPAVGSGALHGVLWERPLAMQQPPDWRDVSLAAASETALSRPVSSRAAYAARVSGSRCLVLTASGFSMGRPPHRVAVPADGQRGIDASMVATTISLAGAALALAVRAHQRDARFPPEALRCRGRDLENVVLPVAAPPTAASRRSRSSLPAPAGRGARPPTSLRAVRLRRWRRFVDAPAADAGVRERAARRRRAL